MKRSLHPGFAGHIVVGARPILARSIAVLLAAWVTHASSSAQTWNATGTDDWNTATNWTPNTVPNSATATAIFGASTNNSVVLFGAVTVGTIRFNPSTTSYTITNFGFPLTLEASGVVNNSSKTQAFVMDPLAGGVVGLTFANSASAGNNVAYTQTSGSTIAGFPEPSFSF